MIKYIICLLFCIPSVAFACKGYVIGFKGLKDAFDMTSFEKYATIKNYCSKVYSWKEHVKAIDFINKTYKPYHLYGYSKGAETVGRVLKYAKRKPKYVITMGAYKTTDVNFDKYKVKYDNYFDDSGIGQKSPGTFLKVPHYQIQKEVNKIIGG